VTEPVRVLVTGHHGYIGSVLAPILRDAGHDVVGLDTYYYRGRDFDFDNRFEAMRELAADARDVRASDVEDFEGHRYVRLRQLRRLIENGQVDGNLRRPSAQA
jgi:nucleoside-diphosphate-sugar epimerase